MLKRAVLLSLPLALSACPGGTAEGEGEGDEGEGEEGEGDEGEGEEGEGDVGEGEGEGEGDACPLVDPCAGVLVDADAVTFGTGAVTVGGTTFTVGTTTRAEVNTALGEGVADVANAFRVTHCPNRLVFQYVDADGALTTEPAAAGADVLSRVLTLADSTATATNGAAIGGAVPDGIPTASAPVGDGEIRFFGPGGLQLLVDSSGDVAQLGAFLPQTANAWTLPITLESDDQALSTLVKGSTFAEANALLGDAFDANGVVDAGGFIGNVQVRIWSSSGVRIAGLCGRDPCSDTTEISSITLSPPFFGKDGSVGIGATRAEVELDVGTGTEDGNVIVYGDSSGFGDPALGVIYVQDTDCVERAAAFIFGYVSLN